MRLWARQFCAQRVSRFPGANCFVLSYQGAVLKFKQEIVFYYRRENTVLPVYLSESLSWIHFKTCIRVFKSQWRSWLNEFNIITFERTGVWEEACGWPTSDSGGGGGSFSEDSTRNFFPLSATFISLSDFVEINFGCAKWPHQREGWWNNVCFKLVNWRVDKATCKSKLSQVSS